MKSEPRATALRRLGPVAGILALGVCMAVALVAIVREASPLATPTAAATPDQGTAQVALGAAHPEFSVAVSQIQRSATIPGAPALASGLRYVTLGVTFENRSTSQQRANPQDFQLVDALGVARPPTFLAPPDTHCPRWNIADLYPNGPGSAPPRDATATQAGRSFGPQPLCFAAGGAADGALTLVWDPDVSMPLFDSPTHIPLQ